MLDLSACFWVYYPRTKQQLRSGDRLGLATLRASRIAQLSFFGGSSYPPGKHRKPNGLQERTSVAALVRSSFFVSKGNDMKQTEKPNIRKLTAYINSHEEPQRFALSLFRVALLLKDDPAEKNIIMQCYTMRPDSTAV